MSTLYDDLTSALSELKHLEKVRQHYINLTQRLRSETAYLTEVEGKMSKEQRDVERLEQMSLHSLFRKILGDKEKQLEKERQEYLHAALRYNDARKSVELIEYEMDLLEPKLATFDRVAQTVAELKQEREAELLASSSPRGQQLRSVFEQADSKNAMLTEIDEAIDAGQIVLDMLRKQDRQLQKAHNWGQWDMVYDGGGWLKHSAIDKAREMLHKVRHALIRFEKEVADVYSEPLFDVDLRIEHIDSFVDIFLDNLITDWVVQKKIKTALDNTRNTIYRVEAALQKLTADHALISTELQRLDQERDRLITTQQF